MGQRPPAIFVADALGLDFLNSIATPVDTPIDWIDDGDGLLNWLEQAHLYPPMRSRALRAQALPGEFDNVADQARSLREWFRGFVARTRAARSTAKILRELEPLNRLLERDESFSRIVAAPRARRYRSGVQTIRRWRIARSAARCRSARRWRSLFVTEDFSDVKACEGPACTLIFADHTRGRTRRWCSMAICGNRAKQAAHRHRLKEQYQAR